MTSRKIYPEWVDAAATLCRSGSLNLLLLPTVGPTDNTVTLGRLSLVVLPPPPPE